MMDCEAIKASPLGTLEPIHGVDPRTGEHYDHFAYVPDPLPDTIPLMSSTWTVVSQAEAALARLDQASQQVPRPALLRQPALRREAQSTNALEGTFAPFEDVLSSDVEDRGDLPMEVRANLNYVFAAELGFEWIAERPLTLALIRQLQGELVRATPDEHDDAGAIRKKQVVVGPRNAPIVEARFVPPPPGAPLRASVEQLMAWIREPPPDLPAVVRAAMTHYQFETLHPFSDGNGRIGRLLIVLQLMRTGVLRDPILVVSPWFETNRDEYQDGLLELSRTGDWDAWVAFFATGLVQAADGTRNRIEALLEWQEGALQRVREAGISGIAERVAGELIGTPVLRASQVVKTHGVSHQGAMNALHRLADFGVLDERTTNTGRKSFFAGEVIELLSR
jgi:Fic family protein